MFWTAMAMSVSAEEPESTLPSVTYQTHVQNVGWQDYVAEGKMSGTEGISYRLEGIRIALNTAGYDLGIQYQTHIQNIGWEDEAGRGWKTDKQMSGTEGLSYRLEAIQIKLTDTDADKFDVYYQVHAQNVGWMGWAKNGESAGTAGYGYRLEGIKIQIVSKGANAPVSTDSAFIEKAAVQQTNIPLEKAGYANFDEVFDEMAGKWTDGNGEFIYISNRSQKRWIQYRGPIVTPAGDCNKASGQYSIDESDTTKIWIDITNLSGGWSILSEMEYLDVGVKGDNLIYIDGDPWTYVSDEPLASF